MADTYSGLAPGLDSPSGYQEVAIADTEFVNGVTRGLWIGTGGNVSIVNERGNTQVWFKVPDGTSLPARAKKVNTTGTTATIAEILGLY